MKASADLSTVEDGAESGLDFDTLDQVLGFHVRQAQGTMHRHIIAVLAEADLTQKQSATLWLIGSNPGTSQIAIGNALRMDRATTMAVIDKLEARTLVIRQRSAVDRRRHELYLTPAGQKLLVEVKAMVKAHEQAFADRFTAAELDTLVALLKRLYV
ncbi:MarR family winged helix-turn-helix transcriptional regulator [Caulobacter sp.]|uniref:MarR family winged helix-turn-helix transcriptional regulator n=1 Tax=Caulobacter sp. TaxID=78 RepID=UPI001B2C4668|nr:MarR family winged helix-turn-helix transcriptional regulator [Caulobacter sp.]MBO9544986.1 winged helix-turn-helix transcriptional regulator [Caulobacter sp.]